MSEIDYTELVGADIQIGAVEIKDASTDNRANVVDTIFGKGLVTKTEASFTPVIPTTPTILNVSVPSGVWTLITTLPSNVLEWTIKAANPNIDFQIAYTSSPTEWITVWRGTILSQNTRPAAIYAYQNTGTNQTIELEYWQP